MARIFISYSHRDDALRAELDAHLALLKREGVLDVWTDHEIPPGGDIHPMISQGLEEADIVLLLISQHFNNSDYCASVEMKRALERHAQGECIAVPVLLRPCDWRTAPYARLNAIPRDGRPVTQWPSQDAAFAEIVKELRDLIKRGALRRAARDAAAHSTASMTISPPVRPAQQRTGLFHSLSRGRFTIASVAAIAAVGGAVIFNGMPRPTPDSAPRIQGESGKPLQADVQAVRTGDEASRSTSSFPAGPVANGVDADRHGPATPASVTPPSASKASTPPPTSVARAGDPSRKSVLSRQQTNDECQRLTGLLAKGALEPSDLQRLKEACNQ